MTNKNTSLFLLGCQGAGKTSFLAGLAVLTQPNNPGTFQLTANDKDTALTLTDLRTLVARQQWPPATANVVTLDFQLIAAGKIFDLSVLEYPGEDLLVGMETMNISNKEIMFEKIEDADAFILLLDPTQDLKTVINSNDQHTIERRQNSLAQAIGLLMKNRIEKDALLPVIVIAITKADMLTNESGGTIEDVARDNETLLQQLGEYSRRKIRKCAISACGPLEEADLNSNNYPTSPQPKGYKKLFKLIGHELLVRRYKRYFVFGISAIVLGIICFLGYLGVIIYNDDVLRRQIDTTPMDYMDRVVTDSREELSSENANALDERVEKVFRECKNEIENGPNIEALERTKKRLEILEGIKHHSFHTEIRELLVEIENLREEALFDAIVTAHKSGQYDLCSGLIVEYFQCFPNGINIDTVRTIEKDMGITRWRKMISDIQDYKITDTNAIESKVKKIEEFLEQYSKTTQHSQTMRVATDFSKSLTRTDSVLLKPTSFGSSYGKAITLQFYKDGKQALSDQNAKHHGTIEGTIQMALGGKLKVQFYSDDSWSPDDLLAEQTYVLLDQLPSFDGKKKILINPRPDGYAYNGYFFGAKLQVRSSGAGQWKEVSEQELTAFGEFIHPGDKWTEVLKERE